LSGPNDPMSEKTFAEILEDATDRSRDMDAPLGERLKAVADEVRRLSPEFADIVDRMVARLEAKGVGQSAPQPGEPMPDFMLPDEGGRPVRLTDLLEKGGAERVEAAWFKVRVLH
jgi:hypothetical protein